MSFGLVQKSRVHPDGMQRINELAGRMEYGMRPDGQTAGGAAAAGSGGDYSTTMWKGLPGMC